MLSFSDFLDKHKDPLYVSVDPDVNTKAMLSATLKQYSVPNPHSSSKMHCTLIYSTKPCAKPNVNSGKVFAARVDRLDIFKGQNGKNCLVLKLNSPELEARHVELMKETEGSYDFDKYLPHVTLSYDVGDFDISQIQTSLLGTMFFSNESAQVLIQGYD